MLGFAPIASTALAALPDEEGAAAVVSSGGAEGYSAAACLALLQNHLPPGVAWARHQTAVLTRFLQAFADALADLDAHLRALMAETDPRGADQLLSDYEAMLGLSATYGETLEARRARVTAWMTAIGGQSAAYFIGIAAALGIAITIEDQFWPASCEGTCEQPLYGEEWKYVWRVTAPAVPATGDHEALETTLKSLAPAHTLVIFVYGG